MFPAHLSLWTGSVIWVNSGTPQVLKAHTFSSLWLSPLWFEVVQNTGVGRFGRVLLSRDSDGGSLVTVYKHLLQACLPSILCAGGGPVQVIGDSLSRSAEWNKTNPFPKCHVSWGQVHTLPPKCGTAANAADAPPRRAPAVSDNLWNWNIKSATATNLGWGLQMICTSGHRPFWTRERLNGNRVLRRATSLPHSPEMTRFLSQPFSSMWLLMVNYVKTRITSMSSQ